MDKIEELVESLGFLESYKTVEYIVYENTIDNIFYSLYMKCDGSNIIMDNTSFGSSTHRQDDYIIYIERDYIDSDIVIKLLYEFFKVKLRKMKLKTLLNKL